MTTRNDVLLVREQLFTDEPDRWNRSNEVAIFDSGTMTEDTYRIVCEVFDYWLTLHSK